jgi:hypothetical protein
LVGRVQEPFGGHDWGPLSSFDPLKLNHLSVHSRYALIAKPLHGRTWGVKAALAA